MKTMNNFAAQQLTKKQMNKVKGGGQTPYQTWECRWDGGMTILVEKDFPKFVEEIAGTGVVVTCHMV